MESASKFFNSPCKVLKSFTMMQSTDNVLPTVSTGKNLHREYCASKIGVTAFLMTLSFFCYSPDGSSFLDGFCGL